MNAKVKEQILAIRDMGVVNMFRYSDVRNLANELGYTELAIFLVDLDNRREYAKFIMYGEKASC